MKKVNNNHIKITFTGDLMSSFAMDEYCRKEADNYDYHCLFDNIRNRLYESDYVIANLETTISGKELKFTDSCGSFNTPKQFLEAVKEAGINFVTTANNHILDRGIEGMVNTLDELDKIGICHTGAYRKNESKNVIIDFNGCRIAILSFTYGTNSEMNHCYLDESNDMLVDILRKQPATFDFQILPSPDKKIQYLIERIKKKLSSIFHIHYQTQVYDTSSINDVANPENLKYEERAINKIRAAKKNADLVYVCLHCGGQYNNKIGEYTNYITSKICNTGIVDAIVTNHPHCILPYRFIGNTLITYGLGNFIFSPDEWTRNDVLCEYNILLNAHIDIQNKKMNGWTFSIIKNEKMENGIMRPINIFDLKEKSQRTLSEIRKIFKRFGYSTKNIQILKEYNLSR